MANHTQQNLLWVTLPSTSSFEKQAFNPMVGWGLAKGMGKMLGAAGTRFGGRALQVPGRIAHAAGNYGAKAKTLAHLESLGATPEAIAALSRKELMARKAFEAAQAQAGTASTGFMSRLKNLFRPATTSDDLARMQTEAGGYKTQLEALRGQRSSALDALKYKAPDSGLGGMGERLKQTANRLNQSAVNDGGRQFRSLRDYGKRHKMQAMAGNVAGFMGLDAGIRGVAGMHPEDDLASSVDGMRQQFQSMTPMQRAQLGYYMLRDPKGFDAQIGQNLPYDIASRLKPLQNI
jgi:hypothetical protein